MTTKMTYWEKNYVRHKKIFFSFFDSLNSIFVERERKMKQQRIKFYSMRNKNKLYFMKVI